MSGRDSATPVRGRDKADERGRDNGRDSAIYYSGVMMILMDAEVDPSSLKETALFGINASKPPPSVSGLSGYSTAFPAESTHEMASEPPPKSPPAAMMAVFVSVGKRKS